MSVASGAALTVRTLTIANGSSYSLGSAISNCFPGGTLIVSDSIISGNNAFQGGAICNDGTATITNSTIFNNGASHGGAIYSSGVLTITNSTFSANNAGSGPGNGGAILNNGNGKLNVAGSTFSANTAADAGGAIINGGALTITNTTFSGNNAHEGGGIDNLPGSCVGCAILKITNSTFASNYSLPGNGGNVYNHSGNVAIIKSTIMGGYVAGGDCRGPITDAGYNISRDTTCGFAKTGSAHNGDNVNPLLSTSGLTNNGGPRKTIALQSNSPAIDAIPLANCTDQASPPNPIIIDQWLFPRPDAGESKCDIGAYEVQDAPFVPFTSFNGSVTIDPDAGVFALLGGFTVRTGVTINPITQPVAFGIGSYAIRLPAGSFARFSNGYVYKKTVNGVSLRINIQFTRVPIAYTFQAYRSGGTIDSSTSPLPATLTIGNNVGTKQMNATYY